jgi:hypothetical protein
VLEDWPLKASTFFKRCSRETVRDHRNVALALRLAQICGQREQAMLARGWRSQGNRNRSRRQVCSIGALTRA